VNEIFDYRAQAIRELLMNSAGPGAETERQVA
jgi:hypothetical protein